MNLGEIYAKFKLDTGNFKAQIGDVTGGLKNVETGARGATPPVNALGGSIQSLALKVGAAIGLFKLADSMTATIKESTLLAARVETLGVVMGTVGKNVGLNAQQMENYAQGVAKMGITTQVSRETVIRMVQAQMDLTQATKLARIAQDAAVVGNTNSSEALQKMIYGIQTGQIEVLKTIGLNVNFENSYKKLAQQLGKTSDDLTELEKTQARTNVVIEAGTRIAGSYESAMGTAGKQLNTLPRYIEEVKLSFGELFKPALGEIVTGITEAFKKLGDWFKDSQNQAHIDTWKGRFKYLGEAIGGVAVAVSDLIMWLGKLGSEPGTQEKQLKLAEKFVKNQQEINKLQTKSTSVLGGFAEDISTVAGWGVFGAGIPVAKELLGYDDKRLERLKAQNIEILKQWKIIGSLAQSEREGAAWEMFGGMGQYPGEQKFDVGAVQGLTTKQLELQKKLNADLAALDENKFAKFRVEFEEREKIVRKDVNLQKSLNEWAAKETEKIWRESDEKIAEQKAKSEEAFIIANYENLWKQRQAIQDAKDADVKINQEAIDQKNKNEEEFILANYKRLDEQMKLPQILFENEKKLSLERITLEAQLYADLKGYGNEYYEAQRKLIAQRVEDMKKAGIDIRAIAAWEAEEIWRADQKKLLSSQNFFDGLKAGYRENIKVQKTWAEEGKAIWDDFTKRRNDATNQFVDNFIAGQDMMVSAQKAAGDLMTNLAGDISKRMWSAAIDKIVSLIGAYIGQGAAASGGAGAMKGGVAGALTEIGIYLATAVGAMLAGRGAANAFKAKGGWIEQHPMGGWIREGSGSKDDVYLGSTPGVRHWGMGSEFIVNKKAAAKFGPLLESINKNHAEGGPVGAQADWTNVADTLVAGSAASFLHGFSKGALWGGIAEAIAFNATAIPTMFTSKYAADKFRAKGGWMNDVGYGFFDWLPLPPALPFIPKIPGLPGILQPRSYTDPEEGRRLILDIVRAPYEQIAKDIMTPGKYYSDPIDVVGNLLSNIGKIGSNLLIPQFAQGTGYVPHTGPAIVHEGERIIPKGDNRNQILQISCPIYLDGQKIADAMYQTTKRGIKAIHPRGISAG